MSEDSSSDQPFSAFETELRRYDPELEGLEGPAQAEMVAQAEASLSVKLPPSYKTFLSRWNGGNAHDTSIYGVACEEGYDLVILNQRGRREGLPEHLVGFASTITGDVYCFDTSQMDEEDESPVSLLDIEQGQVIPACATFGDWLDRLPDLESELADKRGPQPMTVEEWESFLNRERAKLRRLSKTPARELTMPDPEQVRADLAGKIPVDPRHLKPKS